MSDHTRLRAALSMVDARHPAPGTRAGEVLSQDDAAEIIDVLMAEFGADLSAQPNQRHKLCCLGLCGMATGGPAYALLAWTLAARAQMLVEVAA